MTQTTQAGGNAPVPGPGPSTATRTFLFTDIEGSTRRWEAFPAAMRAALARHDAILRSAIEDHGGTVFKTVGDAFCAVFVNAADALVAAIAAQRALLAEDWSTFGADFAALRVRTGVHTGSPEERGGDYFGPDVNRVARLMACGHGGQVLVSGATAALVGDALPTDCALRDLGERRLKDLRQPERVFQIVAPDLPGEFPPLATLDARANNLPIQLTSFVGREAEVAELCQRLRAEDGPRLVTLTGAGGTGKTRLALQVAADLIDDFDHGVWFVDLAALADPELVAPTIANALGVPDVPGQDTITTVRNWLGDRHLLVVLDNYERLLDAAPLVSDLLAGAPRLTVLVTSREPLRLRGERTIPVQPLAVPAVGTTEPLTTLVQYDAVSLFLQRAAEAWPEFAVTAANAPAIAEICARLDGLPLAIELAAVRVRVMAVGDILARLGQRLRLLTQGARDLPERHRTIRAAIAWSYDLLEPPEQRLFRRLAVLAGGAHVESAEAVCDAGGDLGMDVVDGLASLVEKSLVRRTVAEDGWSRYRMLETVREFAGEELVASGEAEAMRARHARYFVDRCQRMWRTCEDVFDAVAWDRHVEAEEANIHVTLDWCLAHDPGSGQALVLALNYFWLAPHRWSEGQRWIAAVLDQSPQSPASARAGALLALGSIAHAAGDFATSEQLDRSALQLYLDGGDSFGAALAQGYLAWQLQRSGREAECRANLAESLRRAESSGNVRAKLCYHSVLANLASEAGDMDAFLAQRQAMRQLLADPTSVPHGPVGLFWSDAHAAWVLYLSGRLDDARAILDRLVAEHRERGEVDCALWDSAGRVLLAQGLVGAAGAVFREGLRAGVAVDATTCIAWHMEGLASVALKHGDADRAARLFGGAATIREAVHFALEPAEEPRRAREMAELRAALGDAGAEAALAEGRALSRKSAVALALEDGDGV